jgi:hypothetical protein
VANPLKWIVPAGIGAVVVVGASLLFMSPKGSKHSKDQPTPDATPIPTAPPEVTPVPVKPTPSTPTPTGGKEVTVTDLATFANRGEITEKMLLVGEYRVSSALDRVVIARPTAKELTSQVRVTARFPQGTRLPAEGSTVKWTSDNGLVVREVRKGNDGQLNIEVEKER